MAFYTYELQPGVFCTTDTEPPAWTRRFPLTDEQEAEIRGGADLAIAPDGDLLVITQETLEYVAVEEAA